MKGVEEEEDKKRPADPVWIARFVDYFTKLIHPINFIRRFGMLASTAQARDEKIIENQFCTQRNQIN